MYAVKSMKVVKPMLIASALLISGHALAGPSFYAGGSLGMGEVFDYDRKPAGKVFGGVQVIDNFAVEGGYTRLKSESKVYGFKVNAEDEAYFVSAVGRVPVASNIALFGKATLGKHEYSSLDLDDCDYWNCYFKKSSGTETALGYGLGAEFKLGRMASIRAEYEQFSGDVKYFSVGGAVHF